MNESLRQRPGLSANVAAPAAVSGVEVSWCLGGAHLSLKGAEELRPGLTVAVCTYRRAASLARFLDSLAGQERKPDHLTFVDASHDVETESMLRTRQNLRGLAGAVSYFRVGASLRGLTKQRNFAARWVRTDLLAFFDDDIVLLPGCLREMERVHRETSPPPAGVAAWIETDLTGVGVGWYWRTRRWLGVVSTLEPGRYCSNGFGTPWRLAADKGPLVEGDYLPGGCTMWRTDVVIETRFHEGFAGYAQGEDVEFSLRAGRRGRLLRVMTARVQHLHDASGRPDWYAQGRMAIENLYSTLERVRGRPSFRTFLHFIYAASIDSLMLLRMFFTRPRDLCMLARRMLGRLRGLLSVIWRWSRGEAGA
jgi:GT2 family glycosyltransferase